MNIVLKSPQMEITPAIRSYVEKKLSNLQKFSDEQTLIEVDLGKITNHHKNGDVFKCEINFSKAGEFTRVESVSEDLYTSIDNSHTDLFNALSNKKGKKRTLLKKGAYRVKEFIRGMSKRKRK